MAHPDTTVWLQPAQAGCGHCIPHPAGPVCASTAGLPCAQPRLEGDPAHIEQVLQQLRQVGDAAGNLVDTQRFSALHVTGDEIELTLAFPRRCGASDVLADSAFQVLRVAWPDTDIYVMHAC